MLRRYNGPLLVPAPVVTETCCFLSAAGKARLLDWRSVPRHTVLDLPQVSYANIGRIRLRHAALDPDVTDAAIVWLAQVCGCLWCPIAIV